jgi:hypothetical protein
MKCLLITANKPTNKEKKKMEAKLKFTSTGDLLGVCWCTPVAL